MEGSWPAAASGAAGFPAGRAAGSWVADTLKDEAWRSCAWVEGEPGLRSACLGEVKMPGGARAWLLAGGLEPTIDGYRAQEAIEECASLLGKMINDAAGRRSGAGFAVSELEAIPLPVVGIGSGSKQIVRMNGRFREAIMEALGQGDALADDEIAASVFTSPDFWELASLISRAGAGEKFDGSDVTVYRSGEAAVWFRCSSFDPQRGTEETARLIVCRDVTEFKRVQARLEAAQLHLRQVLDSTVDLVCTFDTTGHFTDVNSAGLALLGWSRDDLCATEFLSFVDPEDRAATIATFSEVLAGRPVRAFENRYMRRDGTRVTLQWSSVFYPERGFGVGIARDVSDISTAQELRRQSEERYRLLFDENPVPLWIYEEDTLRLLDANKAALKNYEYSREEMRSLTVPDLSLPEVREQVRQRLRATAGSGPRTGEWLHQTKSGQPVIVQGWSHPLNFGGVRARLAVALDVTEMRSVQEQLRQAHKMEAIGQLAGGVAHDFNNLLTVINGFASLSIEQAKGQEPLAGWIRAIVEAGERAARLTTQLLAFSRRQVMTPTVTPLNAIVEGLAPMLRRLLPENIELTVALGKSTPNVSADIAQIEQVILNLAINARDAMPSGGKLTLETTAVELSEDYAAEHTEVIPGKYALLAVSDNGQGIAPSNLPRIFEPFFTTKAKGAGTGLGLPTAYGIIRQSGGHIWVYSELGKGTTFKVYLPASGSQTEQQAGDTMEPPRSRRGETILLVEDDTGVRSFASLVLSQGGFRVVEAANGEEALDLVESGVQVDVLITDIVLPKMGGRQLAEELARRRGPLRVLYISGYTENAIVSHGFLDPGIQYLPKPFSPAALLSKVIEVADQEPPQRRILLTGQSPGELASCEQLLSQRGYEVTLVENSDELVAKAASLAYSAVVLLPLASGAHSTQVVQRFRSARPHLPVIAVADPSSREKLLAAGATAFVASGAGEEEMLGAVQKLIG